MDSTNTLPDLSSMQENQTPVCFSCLAKLFERLQKSGHSEQTSILVAAGKLYQTDRTDTPPLSCGMCSQSITKLTIPTVDYDTLPTLLGTLLQD